MASKNSLDAAKLSTNNLIIILVLISLVVIGISGLMGKSLFATIKRDTTVRQKKDAAEKQLNANLDAAPKLISEYAGLGPQKLLLEDALPQSVDFPSLIVTLENMSRQANVRLKDVTPSLATGASLDSSAPAPSSDKPAPLTYDFSITLDGKYADILTYFSKIETSARPMRIVGVKFNGSGSSLVAQVDMQTYYQGVAQLPFSEETVK